MRDFCKVFTFDDIGQVLVINDENEDGNPSVSIKFIPDGLGLCGPSFSWKSNDKGYEQCDKFFDSVTSDTAYSKAVEVVKLLNS